MAKPELPTPNEVAVKPGEAMLVRDVPPTELPDHASPYMRNFSWKDGKLDKRPGVAKLGTALLNGIPIGGARIRWTNGSSLTVALTASKMYKYDTGTSDWVEITAGAGAGLTGAATQPFGFAVWPESDRFCFSQGVDQVQYTDVTAVNYNDLNANAPPCFQMDIINRRLVLIKTVEGGATKGVRVRWSVNGDITDWTGVGSGFRDLSALDDYVITGKRLGGALYLYKSNSIVRATPTGIATAPFQFDESWVVGRGLISGRSLATRGTLHYGLFNDGVFAYSGAQFVPIGDKRVNQAILDTVNPNRLEMCRGFFNYARREYYLATSTGSADRAVEVWVYNELADKWSYWVFSQDLGEMFEYLASSTTTIDALTGTIDEQTWILDAAFNLIGSGIVLIGLLDGTVAQLDVGVYNDLGTAIRIEWQSKDFRMEAPRRMTSMVGLGIEYEDLGAAALAVETSTDGGQNWGNTTNITIGSANDSSVKFAWAWFMVTGNKVRFRIVNQTLSQRVRVINMYPIVADGGDVY